MTLIEIRVVAISGLIIGFIDGFFKGSASCFQRRLRKFIGEVIGQLVAVFVLFRDKVDYNPQDQC
jgi:hypothetical protein